MDEIVDSALPKLKPLPAIHHPTVIWKQEAKMLTLSVQLRGVSSISLRVTSKQLLFWTEHEGKRYVLLIKFYDEINPSKSTHSNPGGCITLCFEKLKNQEWPRLTFDSQKVAYITRDIEDQDDSDDEENWSFAKIRKNVPLKTSEMTEYYTDGIPCELAAKYGYVGVDNDEGADLEREPESDDDSQLDSDSEDG